MSAPIILNKTPRPLQYEAYQMVRQAIGTGSKRPILQAPTGFGKTFIAAMITAGALNKGNRVYFCVPSLGLIDQTVEKFGEEGITNIGVIQGNHPMTDYTAPVQICSIQTIARRSFTSLPHGDLVMIDEAHEFHKRTFEWMAAWNAIPFIGLSATPWTKGLGKHYDRLLQPVNLQQLIDEGWLSPFKVYAPSSPDLKGVRTVKTALGPDYDERELARRMNNAKLVGDIVQNWIDNGEGRPTLCYAVDRAHADAIYEAFKAAGVEAGYIDGFTPREVRNEMGRQLERGALKVIVNIGCLTRGIDWDVRCIILARPTKSEMLFVQIIGRGLRVVPGKDNCLIFDHSDTHFRMGFVTSINHSDLDDGTPRKEQTNAKADEKKAKACPACGALKEKGVHVCPNCGFTPKPQSNIVNAEGELIEIDEHGRKARKYTMAEKEKWYAMLAHYGTTHGKKPGWAYHQYKAKFKVGPPNTLDQTKTIPPDAEVLGYIKYRQIAYAKGMAARNSRMTA